MYDNKKAQITIFVLVGLLLVLGVATTIYLSQGQQRAEAEREEQSIQDFDQAITPITNAIQSCQQRLVEQRTDTLFQRAGHTEAETTRYTYSSPNTYENDAVDFYGDQELIVPYWHLSEDTPDCAACSTETNIPPLTGSNSVQENVEDHIDNNLETCVNDFQAFNDEFTVTQNTDPQTTVSYNREDTTITTDWELTITSLETDASYNVETLQAQSQIPAKKLYEAGLDTLEALLNQNIPAQYVQQILTYNSFDETIPPVQGGTSFGYDLDVWTRRGITNTLTRDLAANINTVQVIGPDQFAPSYRTSEAARFAAPLTTSTTNQDLNEFEQKTHFRPDWPVEVRVDGSDDPVITPRTISQSLSFFTLTQTEKDFTYDITHPLVITLRSSAYNAEGDTATLNFGVENNLRANKPFTQTLYDFEANTENTQNFDFTGLGGTPATITIEGLDQPQGTPVLRCAGETVPLPDQDPTTPVFEALLPQCTNPVLNYQGNLVQAKDKNITIREDAQYNLEVNDLQNTTVTLNKYRVVGTTDVDEARSIQDSVKEGVLSSTPTPTLPVKTLLGSIKNLFSSEPNFEPKQYAVESRVMQRQPRENTTVILRQTDGNYVAEATFSGTQNTAQTQLFPGTYEVQLFSTLNLSAPLTTNEEEICAGAGCGVDAPTCKCETIPSETLNGTLLVGHYETTADSLLEIPEGSSAQVTLPYFAFEPSQIDVTRDLLIMSEVTNISESYQAPPSVTVS